jgi:hypothetical protein
MASPSLRDDFSSTVELYSNFIKKMKAENTQLNVSGVSFARGRGGKNFFGKQSSSGISNISNAAVDEKFFERHAYHALTSEQKNTLCLKQLKHRHFGNGHGGNGNGTGKRNRNGPTIVMATKFDIFILPDDDDESSVEAEGTSNRSNYDLTRQSKNKKRGRN